MSKELKDNIYKRYTEKKLCDCSCHCQGSMVMHCMPCCDFCGVKYLTAEGTLLPEIIEAIEDE